MWSELGHSQLEHNNLADAIDCYLRANDTSRQAYAPQHCCNAALASCSSAYAELPVARSFNWSPLPWKEASRRSLRHSHTEFITVMACRHTEVIAKSAEADTYEELVKYLLMVRKKIKDSKVDSELVFAYAKTNQLGPLEEFISGAQQANLQHAGDRCASMAAAHRSVPAGQQAGLLCPGLLDARAGLIAARGSALLLIHPPRDQLTRLPHCPQVLRCAAV